MEKEFKKLSFLEKQKLSFDELKDYYIKKRKFLHETDESIKNVDTRKKAYYLLRQLLVAQRIINRNKIEIIGDKREKTTKPIIYAVNHIGKFDIEIVLEALKDHTYVLLGDPEYMYHTVEDAFLRLNGVIYVDVYNKGDRKVAKETTIKLLHQGGNVMWFPEGIWNLSPNQIILPCSYGIIDAALESDAVIVPVGIEQVDNKFYVNIGSNIYLNQYEDKKHDNHFKKVAIRDLRDRMATLKWEIWEQLGHNIRENIPNDYYEKFVNERIEEWPNFTIDDINNRVFKEKGISTYDEVFEHLKHIDYNYDNAFLLNGSPKVKRL